MKDVTRDFRMIAHVAGQTADRLLHAPWRKNEIIAQTSQIGLSSLPIITVSTAFAGFVVTQEIAWEMDQALSTVSMVPGITGQFILRELGIAIPALLLVSKAGAAISAEVSTMKITEQVDALTLLKIDPIQYLVVPRFVAALVSGVCLTLLASGTTLGCAMAMAVWKYHFNWAEYVNALRHFVGFADILCAVIKGTIFCSVIPIVSCAYGFRCEGGAEGVGRSTTNSVVTSTLIIILLDFVLSYFFSLVL
jgi:phospholipid/cholesterol/gamma-HCH transport system permease protein